jgi:hypothetical protein
MFHNDNASYHQSLTNRTKGKNIPVYRKQTTLPVCHRLISGCSPGSNKRRKGSDLTEDITSNMTRHVRVIPSNTTRHVRVIPSNTTRHVRVIPKASTTVSNSYGNAERRACLRGLLKTGLTMKWASDHSIIHRTFR